MNSFDFYSINKNNKPLYCLKLGEIGGVSPQFIKVCVYFTESWTYE